MATSGSGVNVGALIASLGMDLSEFEKGLKQAKKEMDDTKTEMKKSWAQVGQSIDQVGQKIKKVGGDITKYVTVPLGLLGGAALKLEMDFETALTKVISLVGVAEKQVAQWRGQILDLAEVTGQMPAALANAMYFITSAGLRGADAMSVLEQSAKASAAGMGDIQLVADIVTDAMNAFGKENLGAAEAMDVLVNAVRLGKVEAEDLVVSMGHVFPVAAKLGVSFRDVSAAIAAMTRTGTPAETAAVQLRQILSQLIGPARESEEAFRILSASMKEGSISAKELRETMVNEGLFAALKKFDDAITQVGSYEMAKQIFGNIRALTGVFDIMGKNIEDNTMIFEDMATTVGRADRAFEIYTQTLKSKWNIALASSKVALTELGEATKKAVIPILETLVQKIQQLTDWFNNLTQEQQQSIIKKLALAAAIGPLLIGLGMLVSSVGKLIWGFSQLRKTILTAKVAMEAFRASKFATGFAKALPLVGGFAAALGGIIVLAWPSYLSKTRQEFSAFNEELEKGKQTLDEYGAILYERIQQLEIFDGEQFGKDLAQQFGPGMEWAAKKLADSAKGFDWFGEFMKGASIHDLQAMQVALSNLLKNAALEAAQAERKLKAGLLSQEAYDTAIAKATKLAERLRNVVSELDIAEETANKLKEVFEETDNSFKRLKGIITSAFKAIEEQGKIWGKVFGEPLDEIGEKIKVVQNQISKLMSPEGGGFTANSEQIQYLIKLYEQLKNKAKDVSVSLESDLSSAFAKIAEESIAFSFIGKEIDVTAEKLKVLEKLVKEVLEGKYGDNLIESFRVLRREYDKLNISMSPMTTLVDEIKTKFKAIENTSKLYGVNIDVLGEKIQFLKQKMISLVENGMEPTSQQILYMKGLLKELQIEYSIFNAVAKQDVWDFLKGKLVETNMILQTLKSSISQVTDAFGKMFTGTKGGFQDMVSSVLNSAKQIIDALLAQAIAGIIAGEATTKGLFGLITAAIGVAALNQMWQNAIPHFKDGGMVYGPTIGMMGEYAGARNNPEVVAPLDKLQSMIQQSSGGIEGDVIFEIDGYKLKGLLQKIENKNRLIR